MFSFVSLSIIIFDDRLKKIIFIFFIINIVYVNNLNKLYLVYYYYIWFSMILTKMISLVR